MNTARTQYNVEDIGQAIGYWLAREQAAPMSIGPNARALADIYGIMLYQRRAYVAVSQLTPQQADALNIALHQMPLL